MEEKLEKLKTLIAEVADINHSIALLTWDQQVYMPSGGAEERGCMLGTLEKIAHEKFTSDEVGSLLEELKERLPELDPDGEDFRIITVTIKDFEKVSCVPTHFVEEKAHVVAKAQSAWMKARGNSDFSALLPHLERIVELSQQYVTFFPTANHPYDVLVDQFEPGMKTEVLKSLFDTLRPPQIELIRAIGQCQQIDDGFLHQDYDEEKMWELSRKVAGDFGYDWKRGRQDPTAHPFCQSMGPDDVRITSRWVPKMPFALLFGTMHETGHALYEQGVGRTWSRTALEGGTSLGMHESQSRLWENLVGRSRVFWECYYPIVQASFPAQLSNVTLDQFFRAINKVSPGNIRIEADEVTYNLHIMLRMELEIGLVDGYIIAKELPEIWNEKMREYLGIVPPDDARGVLQDIHWSGGMLGYFPTYALGNLISAQLWERFKKVNPELEDQIRAGDFSSLLSWLRVKIHQYGRKYESPELVKRVTQSDIDPNAYIHYLESKYSEIYGLLEYP
ncbi:MAG TPA: carboxypeptidase M32 [Prolixibacteraceae bacterium]|jgi:carboxypeptidase Taq